MVTSTERESQESLTYASIRSRTDPTAREVMIASEFCDKFSLSSKRQLRFIRSFVLRTICFPCMLEPSALVAVQIPVDVVCSTGII
jgi:hypothetical protein